jgi:hypothetical protein
MWRRQNSKRKVAGYIFVILGAALVLFYIVRVTLSPQYHLDIHDRENAVISGIGFNGQKVVLRGRVREDTSYTTRFSSERTALDKLSLIVPRGVDWHGQIVIDVKEPPCSLVIFRIEKDESIRCISCMNAHMYIYGSKACPLYSENLRKLWTSKKWILKD